MYNANNYGYNPYGTYIPQRPIQQTTQQDVLNTVQRCSTLSGKPVDSIDTARIIEYPLDGSVSYYPLTDNSTIVTKQLQNDGTTKVQIYKLSNDISNKTPEYITNEELNNAIKKIDLSDIDDLKEELKDIKKEIKDLKKKKDE